MARQMPGFRWAVISGLALTNVISILLLYFAYAQRTLSGPFYKLIVTHRAEVQIIVQIISQLLGMIHNSVLTKLLNVFTVERLQRRSITLDCLKWWNSICQLQLDMSLPLRFLFPLILFMGNYFCYSSDAAIAVQRWLDRVIRIISSSRCHLG